MQMHLLELHLAEDLLGTIQLHPHQLILWLQGKELLEVRDRLLVPQRLEITCRSSIRVIRHMERRKVKGPRHTDNTPSHISDRAQ